MEDLEYKRLNKIIVWKINIHAHMHYVILLFKRKLFFYIYNILYSSQENFSKYISFLFHIKYRIYESLSYHQHQQQYLAPVVHLYSSLFLVLIFVKLVDMDCHPHQQEMVVALNAALFAFVHRVRNYLCLLLRVDNQYGRITLLVSKNNWKL